MPSQTYQARGPVSRTVLITVRVSPGERERLNRLAKQRGETLSRMLVSRWLPEQKRAQPPKAARRANAIERVAVSAPACVPESPVRVRSGAKRLRDVSVIPGQTSLLDQLGGQ